MKLLQIIFSTAFFYAVIRMVTPLLLAALGDLFCERAGVLNFALEGMMLIGAFAGFTSTYFTGNPFVGMLAAGICGGVTGLAYAVCVVSIGCPQVVTCLAFNMLGLGLTTTLNKYVFGVTTDPITANNIPSVGGISLFFFFALFLLPVSYIAIQKTKWGVTVRAVGEYPQAAATVGINVVWYRYVTVIISGILAAIGGASLTIGGLGYFQENMVVGRGYIAYSAVIFGRYNPFGAFAACVLFGMVDALQLRLQTTDINLPYHLFLMLPYVVTVLALAFFNKGSFVPQAQGIFYKKGER